jgi:hypothetical protein
MSLSNYEFVKSVLLSAAKELSIKNGKLKISLREDGVISFRNTKYFVRKTIKVMS